MKPAWILLGLLAGPTMPTLIAQDRATVEAIAPILMAEDRRQFDAALFERSLIHPDLAVRRAAALAIGRIGSPDGTAMLVPLLSAREREIHADAFFSLGLLRDSAAVPAIIRRLRAPDSLDAAAASEAVTALAKIGSPDAARFIGDLLASGGDLPRGRRELMVAAAIMESRRLGALAPVAALTPFAYDENVDLRWRAVYSLGRLAASGSGEPVLRAVRDASPLIRETAARSLTRRFADTTGLAPAAVHIELVRAFDDEHPGVRINALGAAATWRDSTYTSRALILLRDNDQNVRVAAAGALGEFGGRSAAVELDSTLSRRDATWALRRAALLALARLDSARFAARAGEWSRSPDWRDRVVALDGWAVLRTDDPKPFTIALADPEPRVRAAALGAWRTARGRTDSTVIAAGRQRLRDPDSFVRGAAVSVVAGDPAAEDAPLLVAAWTLSASDADPDTRLAIVRALAALGRRDPALIDRLGPAFLARPDDELLRAAAETSWPQLAARWGPAWPVTSRRTLDDYRGVVQGVMLARDNVSVTIDVEGRGSVEIELLGRDAPLTVANFLRLVDQRYFDGNRWHRVVPNFVIQDGDRTGTGSGGPGWAIRDEINRQRYDVPMLGMALSGPDTGGSQWFINLSPQPHLDGIYAIFGRVTGSYNGLRRITQGDVIRSIRRSRPG
ncbi:MAG: HEAT repeat domain-containing protein [Gemmatimonadales bacterium]|nr:HEAT repeat domain-containing protein [Gemmatimonadales bacterium]